MGWPAARLGCELDTAAGAFTRCYDPPRIGAMIVTQMRSVARNRCPMLMSAFRA